MAEGDSQAEGHEFWSELESIARPRAYKAGAFLFEQGAEPAGIYLMRRGNVSSQVRQSMLAEAASGTILGLSECLSADAHKVTAEALTRVEVSFVNRPRLLIYLREHPKVCMQIVRSLSEK